jgi:hypothetical protein
MKAAATALLAASLIGCAAAEEPVGVARQAVQNGAPDSSNAYPAVLLVRVSGTECSGTLVGASWVMSAVHCFFDADHPDYRRSDFDVLFGENAELAKYRHSYDLSGEVALMSAADWSWPDDAQVAQDIAVFRLDEPVPASIATPEAVPLVAHVCRSGFDAHVVGYGPQLALCRSSVGQPERRIGTVRSAEVVPEPEGDVFFVSELVSYDWCAAYGGNTPGDSGGPLFRETRNDRLLCGTVSGYAQLPAGFGWEMEQKYAAIDSFPAQRFFASVTARGHRFLDEAATTRRTTPPDGPLFDPQGSCVIVRGESAPRGFAAFLIALLAASAGRRRRR